MEDIDDNTYEYELLITLLSISSFIEDQDALSNSVPLQVVSIIHVILHLMQQQYGRPPENPRQSGHFLLQYWPNPQISDKQYSCQGTPQVILNLPYEGSGLNVW